MEVINRALTQDHGSMKCPKCNKEAANNFCSFCGAKLKWKPLSTLTKYQDIISDERCQKIIMEEAEKAKTGMTAMEFLQYAQLVLPGRIPLSMMASISASIGEKLHWGKEKHGVRVYHHPYPYVILAVLVFLARHSLAVKEIKEADKRCLIVASVPSTATNLNGKMEIIVKGDETKTQVLTEAKLFGQWLDWGKTERLVDDILADIEKLSKKFIRNKNLK